MGQKLLKTVSSRLGFLNTGKTSAIRDLLVTKAIGKLAKDNELSEDMKLNGMVMVWYGMVNQVMEQVGRRKGLVFQYVFLYESCVQCTVDLKAMTELNYS